MAASPISNTFGISYTPSSVSTSLLKLGEHSIASLRERGVRYIRFQWHDYTNVTRYRIVPLSAFAALLASSRPGIGITKAALGLIGISLAPGFTGSGEYLYTPDLSSMRRCGYAPGHASVLGWFEEKEQVKGKDGRATFENSDCPRTILKRIVEDAHMAGVEFLVGIETEFILLKSTDPIEAVNDHPWSVSAALPTGSVESVVMDEIADALETSGIELLMYHAEAAPGQYEVVTGPLPPLQAADALITTRETIFNIAAKHGLRATMAPRVYSDNCGSAAHAHISVHPTADRATKPPLPNPDTNKSTTMTPLERSFVQSLLEHLPALAPFTLPTQASYARVQDGVWSGGTYACWGRENREALVRLTGPQGSHHLEVRSIDGTAAPHIALAALLAAGMLGVTSGRELEIMECEGMARDLSESQRKRMGIVGRMPRNLKDAREMLRNDKIIWDALGIQFVEKYLAVNETLEKSLDAGSPAADMKRLIELY